jgi:uncharacterized membrane protein YfcA
MTFIIIGLIVGLVMGLTGAGGALVSIPLFLNFAGVSLKAATTLSLMLVSLSGLLIMLTTKDKCDKKIVWSLGVFGTFGNMIGLPFKNAAPEWFLTLILCVVGLFGIFTVWTEIPRPGDNPKISWPKTMGVGLFVGALTTLTGLGGGIILVPILLKFFGKNYQEALPTSILSIVFISGISLIIQIVQAKSKILLWNQIFFILLGALFATVSLKLLTSLLPAHVLSRIRKIIFTFITIFSLISIILKTI